MHFKRALVPALAWTLFIATSLLLPTSAFPKFSWSNLTGLDKLVHLILFYLLATLWLLAFLQRSELSVRNKLTILVLCVLYGGAMEALQGAMSAGRSMDYADAIANTVGALLAYVFLPKTLNLLSFIKKYLPFIHKLYK